VHCGENSRTFRDAVDYKLPVTKYFEADSWIYLFLLSVLKKLATDNIRYATSRKIRELSPQSVEKKFNAHLQLGFIFSSGNQIPPSEIMFSADLSCPRLSSFIYIYIYIPFCIHFTRFSFPLHLPYFVLYLSNFLSFSLPFFTHVSKGNKLIHGVQNHCNWAHLYIYMYIPIWAYVDYVHTGSNFFKYCPWVRFSEKIIRYCSFP
jgi:hypothetical protein